MSLAKKIRIVIVDDHPLIRKGVSETLSETTDLETVGLGQSAADAIRLADEKHPDLMLLDIALPGGGIEAARKILETHSDIKVAMLTIIEDQATVRAALRTGVHGYLVKCIDGSELVATLRRISSGERYVTPGLAAELLSETESPVSQGGLAGTALSARQRQVVELLANGRSNQEIADELGLATNTVKRYVALVMERLGVRNRTEAAIVARTGNAIEPR